MDLDRHILQSLDADRRNRVWRIYSWDPPAVSLGKNQKIDQVLDQKSLQKAGVTVVKRPTGGRAIYHKNDICISCAAMLEKRGSSGAAAKEIYLSVAEVLRKFFDNLKTNTVLARGPRLDSMHRSGIGKLPCFLSATPYELLASGKKIAGIALYLGKDRFLVQSSIRIKAYNIDDFRFFTGLHAAPGMLTNITSIEEESGRLVEEREMEQSLIKTLSEVNDCVVNIVDVSEFN